jgi:hypothetical protein
MALNQKLLPHLLVLMTDGARSGSGGGRGKCGVGNPQLGLQIKRLVEQLHSGDILK